MWRIFLLLFVILAMISITSSITLYNYYSNQQRSLDIVNDISNKLDSLHNQSVKVINQTAINSNSNTILLAQIIDQLHKTGNATAQANAIKVIQEDNKILHELLNRTR